ncbi:MAG: AraC family transcriptional regulator [Myxococcales bacterium]|nr:AraC family transcriptional regulator [Myxococcales bacterium]
MDSKGGGGTQGTIGVDLLGPFVRRLKEAGTDVERRTIDSGLRILDRAGISLDQLSDPELRLPHEVGHLLLADAVRTTGDPAWAFRAGLATKPDEGGLFEFVCETAATLRESMLAAQRYLPLMHDCADIRIDEEGELALWRYRVTADRVSRIVNEYVVASFSRNARRMLGVDRPPIEVHFVHPAPPYAGEIEEALGCPVHYRREWNAIVIPAFALDMELATARPELHTLLVSVAEERLARVSQQRAFSLRVRQLALAHVAEGCSLDDIAGMLRMSPRTVRRKLAAEGSSYSDIVDAVRRERALDLLDEGNLTVSEVSYALGFAHPPTFQRAFHRWFGTAPGALRRQRSKSALYRYYLSDPRWRPAPPQ